MSSAGDFFVSLLYFFLLFIVCVLFLILIVFIMMVSYNNSIVKLFCSNPSDMSTMLWFVIFIFFTGYLFIGMSGMSNYGYYDTGNYTDRNISLKHVKNLITKISTSKDDSYVDKVINEKNIKVSNGYNYSSENDDHLFKDQFHGE